MIRWAMVELVAGAMPTFPPGVQGRRSLGLDGTSTMVELDIPSDELLRQIETMSGVSLYPHLSAEETKLDVAARTRLARKGGRAIRVGMKVCDVLEEFCQQKGLRFEP